MKKRLTALFTTRKSALLIMLAGTLIISSCTKQGVTPADTLQPNSSQTNDALAALTKPAPGNYQVALFVDDRDTSTADFNGYVFNFKADGTLTAKVGTSTFTGKWESKDNGKELKLDIDGTAALHEINKGWNVIKITNAVINLNDPEDHLSDSHNGEGTDVLVFTRVK